MRYSAFMDKDWKDERLSASKRVGDMMTKRKLACSIASRLPTGFVSLDASAEITSRVSSSSRKLPSYSFVPLPQNILSSCPRGQRSNRTERFACRCLHALSWRYHSDSCDSRTTATSNHSSPTLTTWWDDDDGHDDDADRCGKTTTTTADSSIIYQDLSTTDLEDSHQHSDATATSVTSMTGTVKYYDRRKVYGFIVPDNVSRNQRKFNSDIFFHRSSILTDPYLSPKQSLYYPFLRAGERVRFQLRRTMNKLSAPDESSSSPSMATNITWLDGSTIEPLRRNYLHQQTLKAKQQFAQESYQIMSEYYSRKESEDGRIIGKEPWDKVETDDSHVQDNQPLPLADSFSQEERRLLLRLQDAYLAHKSMIARAKDVLLKLNGRLDNQAESSDGNQIHFRSSRGGVEQRKRLAEQNMDYSFPITPLNDEESNDDSRW
jgi:cold shock CspA family protein